MIAPLVVLAGAALVRVVLMAADRDWRCRLPAPRRVRAAIEDAALPVGAEDAWTAVVAGAAVGGGGGALMGGLALGVLAVAVVAGAPCLVLLACRGRAARLLDAALPADLDAVSRSLRTGASLPQALREGGLGHLVGDGAPLVESLDAWPARCPTAGVRLASAALALAAEHGGAASRAVDGVAATLRANVAVASELRAQAAQARLSGLVIAVAPLGFAALAAATDSRAATFLLRTRFGLLCLTGGLALDAVAAWWMHRITAGAT